MATLKATVWERWASAWFEFPSDFTHQCECQVTAIALGTAGHIAGGFEFGELG